MGSFKVGGKTYTSRHDYLVATGKRSAPSTSTTTTSTRPTTTTTRPSTSTTSSIQPSTTTTQPKLKPVTEPSGIVDHKPAKVKGFKSGMEKAKEAHKTRKQLYKEMENW